MHIIADSSGLISLTSKDDSNYRIALRLERQFIKRKGSIVIPSEVFSETLNVIGRKLGHGIALQTAKEIMESNAFFISESNSEIRSRALEKFGKQSASVSFTDCLVMAFADSYEIKEIFGFDETFQKNGYTRFGVDKK